MGICPNPLRGDRLTHILRILKDVQEMAHPSKDDELDAELQAEIRRISTAIDTILKKVDETDPVFIEAASRPAKPKPAADHR